MNTQQAILAARKEAEGIEYSGGKYIFDGDSHNNKGDARRHRSAWIAAEAAELMGADRDAEVPQVFMYVINGGTQLDAINSILGKK